ncbi:roadblock/LC7 domain-containing protein [Streptomyces phaeochromogenes]|uniref:roadblock/LC7 domain-containing protein n=1 Tax=Streptomyces phaeochromogenes TaxID=1923 RepID=UPI002E2CF9AE|nr:roadblock/LC7 domain-containing protein [Streptomyces phaeochromogenes]
MNEKTVTDQTASSDLTWLLDSFKERVSGIDQVLVVSTDGLPLHACTGLRNDDAEHFAAITSGTYSLMRGLDSWVEGSGHVRQIAAQLTTGMYFVTEATVTSLLAVIANAGADAGQVGHEMVLLANQVRTHFGTPSRVEGTAG